jgi:hypothetical protein
MEPVFMILGQSAATAACLALDGNVSVQRVDYAKLRARLEADKQVLAWKGPQLRPASGPPFEVPPLGGPLKGIVMDDSEADKTGTWTAGNLQARAGGAYVHDNNENKGSATITYRPDIPEARQYEFVLIYPPHPNRATKVPVSITIDGRKIKTLLVDQRSDKNKGLATLGAFKLPKGRATAVTVSNTGTSGYVVSDGLQVAPVD